MTNLAPSIASLVERAKAYADRAGLKPSTVSRKVFNDGKYIDRLEAGGDIGVQTLRIAEDTLGKLEAELSSPGKQERA